MANARLASLAMATGAHAGADQREMERKAKEEYEMERWRERKALREQNKPWRKVVGGIAGALPAIGAGIGMLGGPVGMGIGGALGGVAGGALGAAAGPGGQQMQGIVGQASAPLMQAMALHSLQNQGGGFGEDWAAKGNAMYHTGYNAHPAAPPMPAPGSTGLMSPINPAIMQQTDDMWNNAFGQISGSLAPPMQGRVLPPIVGPGIAGA